MKKWITAMLALAMVLALALPAGAASYALPQTERIVYGYSGAGRELVAHRIGNGDNVLIMGFAIHGFEDNFNRDGQCLVYSANQLLAHLKQNAQITARDWTIYVLPCMNPDGLADGWTNNGPGRCTTTYINSSGTLVTGSGKGIDMNRCFPTGYYSMTSARNYNGTQAMACKEARALSDFIKKVKGSGDNLLIDVHGWLQQTITTSTRIRSAIQAQFPNNTKTYSNGGSGYLMAYAHSLGYESCLLELPSNYYSYTQYVSSSCTNKIINVVDSLIQSEPLYCETNGHKYEIVNIPVTCTQDGVYSETCTICGKSAYSTQPALGHFMNPSTLTVTREPTASKSGLQTYACSRCGTDGLTQKIPSIFTDVNENGYYSDPLDLCYDLGYIQGTSKTTFSPKMPLSRGMLVTMLYRLHGEPDSEQLAPFTDLKEGEYYVDAVNWAYGSGVVEGTTETTFEPDAIVTRQQAMAIFFRFVEYLDKDNGKREIIDFPDENQMQPYAIRGAQWCLANGIILGDNEGYLRPNAGTTRAESVTILMRVADYVEAQ